MIMNKDQTRLDVRHDGLKSPRIMSITSFDVGSMYNILFYLVGFLD